MTWFDRGDLRLLVKVMLVATACSSLIVGCAAVAGMAVRVFSIAAG